VTFHAAYTAMFMFMSIFPLIMCILNVLSLLKINEALFTEQVLAIVPEAFHDFILEGFEHLSENSSGFKLSLSAVMTVWSASCGVYGLFLGLNDVYRTYDTRGYFVQRGISILYTIALILLISLSFILLVFGNDLSALLVSKVPALSGTLERIRILRYPVLFVLYVLLFNLMYAFLPKIKRGFLIQTPGSVVSALGWLLFSYIYSIYLNMQSGFSVYGSLTTIVFFLLWLWIVMIIFFVGGELNAVIIESRYGIQDNALRIRTMQEIAEAAKKSGRKDLSDEEKYKIFRAPSRRILMRKLKSETKEEK